MIGVLLAIVVIVLVAFNGASNFNRDLNDWDVAKVTDMGSGM